MDYLISFRYKIVLMICTGIILVNSCSDIIDTDSNLIKTRIDMNAQDSLNQLIINNVDFGNVKYGSVNIDSIEIFNQSANDEIGIFGLSSTNPSNLFTYTFTQGFPFTILPLENTKTSGKIKVKFYAQSFYFKEYTDTLVLNNNPNYKIIIRANVKSF
jgi:hypothetical protein